MNKNEELLQATKQGNLKKLNELLSKGADINAKDGNGNSVLLYAIKHNKVEAVNFLLSKGANLEAKDKSTRTPLMFAIIEENAEMVKFLLSKGAKLEAKDDTGWTPLIIAVGKQNRGIVEFLVSKGADVNAKTTSGITPLHVAAHKNNQELVKFLRSKGADVHAKNATDKTPLNYTKDENVIKLLQEQKYTTLEIGAGVGGLAVLLLMFIISRRRKNSSSREKYESTISESIISESIISEKTTPEKTTPEISDGNTSLHKAVMREDENAVELWSSLGRDTDEKETLNKAGETPLHLALAIGNKNIVNILLSNGAKAELHDTRLMKKITKLLFAKECANIFEADDNLEALKFFIEKGADIHARYEQDQTLLHVAAKKGNKEIVEFLLSMGADKEAKENKGKTPLHVAIDKGDKEIVELLLSKGADIEAKENQGKTPLHVAIDKGDKEIVALLLSMGADKEAKENQGKTPLHVAIEKGQKEIVELLLSKGLDINAKFDNKKTPLHVAIEKGDKEIVELLLSKGAKSDLQDIALIQNITHTLFGKSCATINDAYDNVRALDFFLERGVNIDTKNKNNETTLDLAAKNNQKVIARYLVSQGAKYMREIFTTPQEYRQSTQNIIVCFEKEVLPVAYKLAKDSLVLLGYDKTSATLNELITTLAIKAALKLPDAKCEFMLVDPVGMGKSCNLLHNLDKKFYQKVSTTKQEVEALLTALENHASYVHSNYLKGVYNSLNAYNHDNQEVSEATKFVIVYDYFRATDEEQKKRFQKLFGEAKSVGINFILSYDIASESAEAKEMQDILSLKIQSNMVTFDDDCILSSAKAVDAIQYLNSKLATLDNVKVSYIKNKPEALWSKDSSSFIEANIGKNGRDSLMFTINNQIESHALLIGRSGSGKSNLLHIMISDLVLNYSPQDIKLYLVDMKGGIEFVKYTQMGLPHLEIASITSDREMALTILKRVEGKLNEREKLFSSQGVQNIEQYNSRYAQDKQPRLLLILDEFQELFTKEDSIKREAAEIFDRISKKGRSFGINMILASQSLGGDTLAASTVNQFAIRIVLQCSEDDSRRVLSFDNSEAKFLSKPGEGIYNAQNGSVAGNQKFQTYWLATDEHDALLEEVSALAKTTSVETNSVVFREDLVPSFIESYKKSLFEKSKKEIVFGQPYGFSDYVSLKLKKDNAANVLISGNSQELANQIMVLFLLSLALDASSKKRFYILSSGDEEQNQLQEYTQTLKSCNVDIRLITKRNALEMFGELNQEIQNCIDNDTKMEVENYIFIDNGYKMRALRKESDEYGGSKISQETSLLSAILKNGPEFGVHSFVYIESVKQFDMMFEHATFKNDFENIIALQMSEDDSQRLIGNYGAASLGQSNAIFVVDGANTEVKFRPIELPPLSWVEHIMP